MQSTRRTVAGPLDRWFRAVAVAMLMAFALPSCVTRWVWSDHSLRETAHLEAELARAAPDDAPFPIAIETGAFSPQLAALFDPPPPAGANWLLLEPAQWWIAGNRPLTRPGEVLEVRVVADQVGGSSVLCFLCRRPADPEAPPRRIQLRTFFAPDTTEFYAVDHYGPDPVAIRCRATMVATPPPGSVRQPAVLVLMESYSNESFWGRLAITPLTVAWDALWSPLELLTLPLWW